MKIVKRKEFLLLPANTLFSKYQPCFLMTSLSRVIPCQAATIFIIKTSLMPLTATVVLISRMFFSNPKRQVRVLNLISSVRVETVFMMVRK